MFRVLAPAGVLLAAFAAAPAQAARCPSGQIWRVSLKECAPRASNLQFLRSARAVKPSRPVALPPRRQAEPETDVVQNYTAPPAPADTPFKTRSIEAPAPAYSPYGALR